MTRHSIGELGPHADRHAAAADVVPLLRCYRQALTIAADPPLLRRVPARLARPARRLRPAWGCRYFTARYVRRSVEAVERALAGRIAVNEDDPDDPSEYESLGRFKSSLPPPPSRWVVLGALILAIVLAQALMGYLLGNLFAYPNGDYGDEIARAFDEVDVAADVQSFGSLARALAGGTYEELFVVVVTASSIAYLYLRPLAAGYRLSYILLGRSERSGRRTRESPLRRTATELDIPSHEASLRSATGAEFRRDAPVDVLAKSALPIVVLYGCVGALRFGEGWDLVGVLTVGGFSLFVILRLGWLASQLRRRQYPMRWLAAPVVVVCTLALVVPSLAFEGRSDISRTAEEELATARGFAEFDTTAQASESRLRSSLALSTDLTGIDLRAADLPKIYIRGKTLRYANLTLADLSAGDFRSVDLRNVVARGTYLANADLRGADLRRADLSCAHLAGTDLRGAKLGYVRLDEAFYDKGTQWPPGFDLEGARVQRAGWLPYACFADGFGIP